MATTKSTRRRPQTLAQAIAQAKIKGTPEAYAAAALIGCPVGGWGETEQARAQIVEFLVHRTERAYTVSEFIDRAYDLDFSDRYVSALITTTEQGLLDVAAEWVGEHYPDAEADL